MGCRLTQNITKENCTYTVAGIVALALINYSRDIEYTEEEEIITVIKAKEGGEAVEAFDVQFEKNTCSFSDELAEGGNGGKYRTHTVNFVVKEFGEKGLQNRRSLSLGKFIAVLTDKNGKTFMLGRRNGLDATSMNYESGSADADANGYTVVLAGTEREEAVLLKDESVINSILHKEGEIIP